MWVRSEDGFLEKAFLPFHLSVLVGLLGVSWGTRASPRAPEVARSPAAPTAMPVLSLSWGSQPSKAQGWVYTCCPPGIDGCVQRPQGRPSVWK